MGFFFCPPSSMLLKSRVIVVNVQQVQGVLVFFLEPNLTEMHSFSFQNKFGFKDYMNILLN